MGSSTVEANEYTVVYGDPLRAFFPAFEAFVVARIPSFNLRLIVRNLLSIAVIEECTQGPALFVLLTVWCAVSRFVPVALRNLIRIWLAVLKLVWNLGRVNMLLVKLQRLPIERLLRIIQLVWLLLMIGILSILLRWLLILLRTHGHLWWWV